jgi:putative endonuclease
MAQYCTYILFSDITGKYYVGQTEDFEKRINRHNNRQVTSTKKGVPWKVVKIIPCEDRTLAILLEQKIKKRGIRRYIEDNFGA